MLTALSYRDLQNMAVILRTFATCDAVAAAIEAEINSRHHDHPLSAISPAPRRHPDNITTCRVCGSQAIIVPLARQDRTAESTHAAQCQNRPATDQPWLPNHCGHTEYIVWGDR